jgi:hypothetical protein
MGFLYHILFLYIFYLCLLEIIELIEIIVIHESLYSEHLEVVREFRSDAGLQIRVQILIEIPENRCGSFEWIVGVFDGRVDVEGRGGSLWIGREIPFRDSEFVSRRDDSLIPWKIEVFVRREILFLILDEISIIFWDRDRFVSVLKITLVVRLGVIIIRYSEDDNTRREEENMRIEASLYCLIFCHDPIEYSTQECYFRLFEFEATGKEIDNSSRSICPENRESEGEETDELVRITKDEADTSGSRIIEYDPLVEGCKIWRFRSSGEDNEDSGPEEEEDDELILEMKNVSRKNNADDQKPREIEETTEIIDVDSRPPIALEEKYILEGGVSGESYDRIECIDTRRVDGGDTRGMHVGDEPVRDEDEKNHTEEHEAIGESSEFTEFSLENEEKSKIKIPSTDEEECKKEVMNRSDGDRIEETREKDVDECRGFDAENSSRKIPSKGENGVKDEWQKSISDEQIDVLDTDDAPRVIGIVDS